MEHPKDGNIDEWFDKLEIGDRFDGKSFNQYWCIYRILDINKEKKQLYIHYEGWRKKYDQWIDVDITKDEENSKESTITKRKHQQNIAKLNRYTCNEYAPLNTYTPICEYFHEPKHLSTRNNSTVVYYDCHSTQKRYLIITNNYGCFDVDDTEVEPFVYKYDITDESRMKWIPLVSYPKGFKPINTGNILNNNTLYIFGGKNGCFAKVNIINGDMDVLCGNKIDDKESFDRLGLKAMYSPKMFWSKDHNCLHIFGNVISNTSNFYKGIQNTRALYHIEYNVKEHKFIEISTTTMEHLCNGKIVYIKYLNKFMNFCRKQNIFVCDMNDDQYEFEWKETNIKLPIGSGGYFVVNVYEYVVLIFRKEIWALDLNDDVWYRSSKYCPPLSQRTMAHIVDTKDGWLHFVGGKKYHFKLMIDDVIPESLHRKYDKRTHVLIVGFIKYIETKYNLFSSFNQDLVKMIVSFYPKFGA